MWKVKMIGTTSDMESNADVLYPSITMCSRRKSDEYKSGYNMPAINQRTLNLSNTLYKLEMYVRNNNGEVEKVTVEPNNSDSKIVYGHFALYPDPIIKNGSGMKVKLFNVFAFNHKLHRSKHLL